MKYADHSVKCVVFSMQHVFTIALLLKYNTEVFFIAVYYVSITNTDDKKKLMYKVMYPYTLSVQLVMQLVAHIYAVKLKMCGPFKSYELVKISYVPHFSN